MNLHPGSTIEWDGLTIEVHAIEPDPCGWIWVTGRPPGGRLRHYRIGIHETTREVQPA